jgi:hypothetical protein
VGGLLDVLHEVAAERLARVLVEAAGRVDHDGVGKSPGGDVHRF